MVGLWFCIQLTANAQQPENAKSKTKIIGLVRDSLLATPIEYATVTLMPNGDKKGMNGATTDKEGRFVISDAGEGNYRVLIESIGYKPYTIDNIIINKKRAIIDLKVIALSKKTTTLESVTVTPRQHLIESRIDKIIFNAEKDLTSQGGVATDLLKKIPQVSVDLDGNVELAGNSSIRFLINGKPSTAFGNSISDVLQSIPASQIKSIEVITNPGAKYDAQGIGGIINIILKQSTASGINGSLSLTVGTRIENGSFNFNARKKNFGINAFISGNERLQAKTLTALERISADTASKTTVFLNQDGYTQFKRYGSESGIGFDWTLGGKNFFSGNMNYNRFGNSSNGLAGQQQVTRDQGSGNVISELASANYSHNRFSFHSIDFALNYKRTFTREGQELDVSLNSSYGHNLIYADSYQLLQPQDSLFFGIRNDNPGKEHETELQLDYTQPLKKEIVLDVGGKINYRNITSNSTVFSYQPAPGDYFYDSALSNNLDYRQKVYALYSEIGFPVGGLFNVKLGLRYERTDIDAFFSDARQQVNIPGYNTFVPSIFFSKKLDHGQSVRLSYSRRIERPDYRDLNPFINTSDPKNITAGNPYLKPETGNRIELSYNRDFDNTGSVMITAFYRVNIDDIQPYIVYYPSLMIGDSTYHNTAVSTSQNIGQENNIGFNIFANLHLASRLEIRGNVFIFARHTINRIDINYNSNSFNYRTNINITYQFKHDFSTEFFGNFNSPRNEVQGKYPSFTSYSIALRKQFWNKKASIALTAINPFKERVDQEVVLHGPNFSVKSIRKVPFRSVGLNFTWKFGKLKFKKEREENSDNNSLPEGN